MNTGRPSSSKGGRLTVMFLRVRVTVGAALFVFAGACGSSTPPPQQPAASAASKPAGRAAPEWVMRTPKMKGNICAVGAVEPTFYRQDGIVSAGEAARAELARSVQVKITSVMYQEESSSGGYVDQAFVSEVVGSISDVVLAGSQVMESWYDESGSVSKKGMTYALACMPTDQSAAQLAEKLAAAAPAEENKDKIAAVREKAKAAFDELEAMEAKKGAQ